MGYFRRKLFPWIISVLNTAMVTMCTAGATTFATGLATNSQSINLESNWNIKVTFTVFLISWAVQFFVGFGGLLQKSPIPAPGPEDDVK